MGSRHKELARSWSHQPSAGKVQNGCTTEQHTATIETLDKQKNILNLHCQFLFNLLCNDLDTRTYPSAFSLRELEGNLHLNAKMVRLWCMALGSCLLPASHHLTKVLRVDQDCTSAIGSHWKLVIYVVVLYSAGHTYHTMGWSHSKYPMAIGANLALKIQVKRSYTAMFTFIRYKTMILQFLNVQRRNYCFLPGLFRTIVKIKWV